MAHRNIRAYSTGDEEPKTCWRKTYSINLIGMLVKRNNDILRRRHCSICGSHVYCEWNTETAHGAEGTGIEGVQNQERRNQV